MCQTPRYAVQTSFESSAAGAFLSTSSPQHIVIEAPLKYCGTFTQIMLSPVVSHVSNSCARRLPSESINLISDPSGFAYLYSKPFGIPSLILISIGKFTSGVSLVALIVILA